MRIVFRAGLSVCGVILVSACLSVAAPAKKEKTEPLPPPTAEELAAANNNLQQIALAFHNYHDTHGHMPTNLVAKDKKPLLSWRVQILPFIEADHIYKEFKLDEPWDSEHNKKLIDKMPALYTPVRGKLDKGLTFHQTFVGSNGWCKPGAMIRSFLDGTSNTFLVAEGAKPVIWTKPADLEFNGKDVPALGGVFEGKFHAAMADGSVSLFRKGLNSTTLARLIDPADGNVVDVNDARDSGEDKK
jgi:hypothetical protein